MANYRKLKSNYLDFVLASRRKQFVGSQKKTINIRLKNRWTFAIFIFGKFSNQPINPYRLWKVYLKNVVRFSKPYDFFIPSSDIVSVQNSTLY